MSADPGDTASAPRTENLVEGREMLDSHIHERNGGKCYEGRCRGQSEPITPAGGAGEDL